jgi:hypothetical protein
MLSKIRERRSGIKDSSITRLLKTGCPATLWLTLKVGSASPELLLGILQCDLVLTESRRVELALALLIQYNAN